jgi:SAM-dependent MidA family methyltransferase
MDGNPALVELIRADMRQAGGAITFERFMELALYAPGLGYYTSCRPPLRGGETTTADSQSRPTNAGRPRIGKTGDYFTSVSTGALFGRILARQFWQFRAELGEPADFEVVEFGGHHGQLRDDVLAEAPELRYRVVEVGEPALPEAITGVVFSNEFLDALPVHRVRVERGEWREIFVTKEFTEVTGPLSTPRLAELLAGLPVHLMEGYTTEVNLRALDWLADISRRLTESAYILTIDYGFTREEYFAPHRRDGTLLCYHRHQKSVDPYRHIGEQDITAHVEFTSLMEHGRWCGLEPLKFTDQAHYLLEMGESEISEIVAREAGKLSRERAAIHQLIHPGLMGQAFKVLVQRKQ